MKFKIRGESNFWGDVETCEFKSWEDAARFVLACKCETADEHGRSNRLMTFAEALAFAHESLEEA